MIDLLTFIRLLLINDPTLLSLFVAAGQSSVIACLPNQRDLSTYPTITYEAEQGNEYPSGEHTPKLFVGKFNVEVHTRQSAANQSNYATMLAIQSQIQNLLVGSRTLGTTGIAGTFLPPTTTPQSPWIITTFRSEKPNNAIATIDPTLCRWRMCYCMVLMQKD